MEVHGKYHFKSEHDILRNSTLKDLNNLSQIKKK